MRAVRKFISERPTVMEHVTDMKNRLNLIRTKVMNERNKVRRLFQERKTSISFKGKFNIGK